MGCLQGGQPDAREESIGPFPVIGLTPAHAGTLLLLAQNGAQPWPDEAVKLLEQTRYGVFEVTKRQLYILQTLGRMSQLYI
jgi:hypothetical protein